MKRIPLIDLVRFFSFFIVLGGHYFPQWLCQFITWPWLQSVVLNVFHHGCYGVSCFFVVSGYLITEMLVRGQMDLSRIDLKSFYVRRAARIWPLLALVILSAFLLEQNKTLLDPRVQTYHVWNDETGFGPWFWLSIFTLTFNWYLTRYYLTEGFQWNVLWSLAVEEQFYLFYPLIVRWLGDRRRLLFFLGAVALSGPLFRTYVFHQWGPAPGTAPTPAFIVLHRMASFGNFDQIALGALLFLTLEKWGKWFQDRLALSGSLFFLGLVGCFWSCDQVETETAYEVILGPSVIAGSCAILLLGGLNLTWLNLRLFAAFSWPGKLSYGCYLWHPTIIFLLMPFLMMIGGLSSFVFLTLALVLFAFLSYRVYEVPVNHFVRRAFGLLPSTRE